MAEIIGKSIKKLASVDSTNNYATQQVKLDLCDEGTVIVTKQQTSGRGLQNNKWESESGKNLLLSIVFKPIFLPIQSQFLLSKAVALGIRDTISLYTEQVKIKWPNDIYIGEKKTAGILIENTIMGSTIDTSIAGIGLNVNQTIFYSDAPNPISIAQILNVEIDLDRLMFELIEKIDYWYIQLVKSNFDVIDRAYISAMYHINELHTYCDSEGSFDGTIIGVNPIGQLQIIKKSGGLKEYHFKEVQFL